MFLAMNRKCFLFLPLIVFGGKTNLIVLGGGGNADMPQRCFWCFNRNSKTNLILCLSCDLVHAYF